MEGAVDVTGFDWMRVAEFLVQLGGVLIAAVIVIWQVGRQQRNSLELQRETLRDEQRIRLFNALSTEIAAADTAIVSLSSWGTYLPTTLRLYLANRQYGVRINDRTGELQKLQRAVDDEVIKLITLLEYREIVYPALYAFRIAIGDQLKRARQASQDLLEIVMPILPVDPPVEGAGTEPRALMMPDEARIGAIREADQKLKDEYSTLSNFLNDLNRDIQSALLGTLFGRAVQPRLPLDPSVVVLSTSRSGLEELEQRLDLGRHLHPDALPSVVIHGRTPPQGRAVAGLELAWRSVLLDLWRRLRNPGL